MINHNKAKLIAIILMLNLLAQVIVPIFSIESIAAEGLTEVTKTIEESQEITRNYEIKEEEIWDVSANNDGSVMAKWTRDDRTIVISGTGEMKDWGYNAVGDWHDTQYTNAVEKVVIKEGVTCIGDFAFEYCSSLKSISIPEGVTEIGNYTFYECSSLESIIIPQGVTEIRRSAFEDCSSLESITIPQGVTEIEMYAFDNCISLKSINVNTENKYYSSENGILFNKNKTEIIKYPEGKRDISEYNIPQGVTKIGSSGFYGCSSLKSISIPEGVTEIGNSAFEYCSSLKSISIPEGVTEIGNYTFYECSSLESISIPEGVTEIGDSAFEYCSSLKSISIPEGVTEIGNYTFYECTNLESIVIPRSIQNIGKKAIDKNTIIYAQADSEGHRYAEEGGQGYILEGTANNITTNYEIKEEEIWDVSANNDGSVMAKWTRSNKTIVISGKGEMKDWKYNAVEAWYNTQYTNVVEKVVIEEGITSIGDYVFEDCSSLKSVTIPQGVTKIEEGAFWGCISLESITIPQGVTKIEEGAFCGCISLESIIIPEEVIEIGEGAFADCYSLKSITIPQGVTEIGMYAFDYCISLKSINVNTENIYYSTENGVLFNKNKTKIIKYPEGRRDLSEYNIPQGVTEIGEGAFSGCNALKSITIPQGITKIEDYAFYECGNLESIIIPEGVTEIGKSVFIDCSSLKSIVIPKSIKTIGKNAIDKNTIIYAQENSEGHRYAEEGGQGYIIIKIISGDINQDGQINTLDMIKILRHISVSKNQSETEENPTWKLQGEEFTLADINKDEQVNTLDIIKILRHISASKDSTTAEKHPDWIITK